MRANGNEGSWEEAMGTEALQSGGQEQAWPARDAHHWRTRHPHETGEPRDKGLSWLSKPGKTLEDSLTQERAGLRGRTEGVRQKHPREEPCGAPGRLSDHPSGLSTLLVGVCSVFN